MMEKKHPISLNTEEEAFINRMIHFGLQFERKGFPHCTAFLDLRQQELVTYAMRSAGITHFVFEGGYPEAERKVLHLYDDFPLPKEELPMELLTITYSNKAELNHRDFLGSILALGIKREVLGDIIVDSGKSYLWVLEKVKPLILSELTQISRYGVSISDGNLPDAIPKPKMSEIIGTVSSLRIDCVVCHLLNCNREEGTGLVKSGFVAVNGREITEPSKNIEAASILSIRRHGRFLLEQIGSANKKGRIRIVCKKYC